jgi:choline dehydrogenase-like flavoprotein
MDCVIGSGPSGISAAAALIEVGRSVILIDVGLELESERDACRRSMAVREPHDWSEREIVASKSQLIGEHDDALKLSFGSDYIYRDICAGVRVDWANLAVRASYASGGLSNVWGAALLPFRQGDIGDWPISCDELSDAHASVLKLMPVAARRNELVDLFPLPAEQLQESHSCRQIEKLMANLRRNQKGLAERGVSFGSSRLAVRFEGTSSSNSCNYCGHCLHGCPRDLIYSSRQSLRALIATGRLVYERGVKVDRVLESGQSVLILGNDSCGPRRFEAQRAFLAAGVFNSTAILLRSFGWYDRHVTIADSQHYLLPLLQATGIKDVRSERLHTMAQAFIEILDGEVSPYTVHLQLYGFNDLLPLILKHKLGFFYHVFPENILLSRLLSIQGYLHSAHSGKLSATLKRGASNDTLVLEEKVNPETEDRVLRVVRKIRRLSGMLRAMPLRSLLRVSQVGRGFHCGGSFPMAKVPRVDQTDTMGRPFGLQRTHVVDSTVLPSIPATTITQTVMANASRIAVLAAQQDSAPRG